MNCSSFFTSELKRGGLVEVVNRNTDSGEQLNRSGMFGFVESCHQNGLYEVMIYNNSQNQSTMYLPQESLNKIHKARPGDSRISQVVSDEAMAETPVGKLTRNAELPALRIPVPRTTPSHIMQVFHEIYRGNCDIHYALSGRPLNPDSWTFSLAYYVTTTHDVGAIPAFEGVINFSNKEKTDITHRPRFVEASIDKSEIHRELVEELGRRVLHFLARRAYYGISTRISFYLPISFSVAYRYEEGLDINLLGYDAYLAYGDRISACIQTIEISHQLYGLKRFSEAAEVFLQASENCDLKLYFQGWQNSENLYKERVIDLTLHAGNAFRRSGNRERAEEVLIRALRLDFERRGSAWQTEDLTMFAYIGSSFLDLYGKWKINGKTNAEHVSMKWALSFLLLCAVSPGSHGSHDALEALNLSERDFNKIFKIEVCSQRGTLQLLRSAANASNTKEFRTTIMSVLRPKVVCLTKTITEHDLIVFDTGFRQLTKQFRLRGIWANIDHALSCVACGAKPKELKYCPCRAVGYCFKKIGRYIKLLALIMSRKKVKPRRMFKQYH